MYTKAHPFNYISRARRNKRTQCFGNQCMRTQTIYMKDGSVKQIYHITHSVKKGRTLADMVYESFPV